MDPRPALVGRRRCGPVYHYGGVVSTPEAVLARLLVGGVRVPSLRIRERGELEDADPLDPRTLEHLEERAEAHERLYVVDGRELGSGVGVDLDLLGVASSDAREDDVGCRFRLSTGVGGGQIILLFFRGHHYNFVKPHMALDGQTALHGG